MHVARPLVARPCFSSALVTTLTLAGFLVGCSGGGDSVTPPTDVTKAPPVAPDKVEAKKPAAAGGFQAPGKKGGPD